MAAACCVACCIAWEKPAKGTSTNGVHPEFACLGCRTLAHIELAWTALLGGLGTGTEAGCCGKAAPLLNIWEPGAAEEGSRLLPIVEAPMSVGIGEAGKAVIGPAAVAMQVGAL